MILSSMIGRILFLVDDANNDSLLREGYGDYDADGIDYSTVFTDDSAF